MTDQERDAYQRRVRELAALRAAQQPTFRQKLRALLGKHPPTPIPVTPKRAGGGEVCGGPCGQPMIAGSIGLHRNLLCGECRAHDLGSPMAPREPVTDDEPHAA